MIIIQHLQNLLSLDNKACQEKNLIPGDRWGMRGEAPCWVKSGELSCRAGWGSCVWRLGAEGFCLLGAGGYGRALERMGIRLYV